MRSQINLIRAAAEPRRDAVSASRTADIACRTTAELSSPVAKRTSGKQVPGQSRYSCLALADAQQRYDVIGDLPSEAGLLVLVCGW
jgi:hypothetical protein